MSRRSWALPVFAVTFMTGALFTVLAGGEEKPADGFTEVHPTGTTPPPPAAAPVPSSHGGVVSSACLADQSVVEDLRRRRTELEAREKDLQSREAELAAKERAVEEELQKIAQVRSDVEKIESARKKEGDERVTKLVETFETMSPKGASALLATLDESLAVATMSKIATPRLAKIMNSMEPRKSARLSELLAGVVRARGSLSAANAVAATTSQSVKGGGKNDGQIEQHDKHKLGERPETERKPGAAGSPAQERTQPGNQR
jgi:flagellar motility protein MotE (MotC chaperone)